MATKEELSNELNEMLDMDIEWSELKKEDLELFIDLVEDGALLEPMAKVVVKEKGQDKLEEQVDDWYPGKFAARVL